MLDESFLHELPDRLPDRAAARSQLAREVHLAELFPLGDAPVDDRIAQLRQDLLSRRRPLDGA